jgi:hypothetical protein
VNHTINSSIYADRPLLVLWYNGVLKDEFAYIREDSWNTDGDNYMMPVLENTGLSVA